MRYQGGKARLARHLAPHIKATLAERGGRFVEPFVGGFNIVPALGDAVTWAFCSDVHPGLIALYLALQRGWTPPAELSRADYDALRATEYWPAPLTAFAAFGCSFGGKEWGGYASGEGRNYAAESRAALLAKVPHMRRANFLCRPYDQLGHDRPAVVYCDPPYRGTTGYAGRAFDNDAFERWAQNRTALGDIVLVSEFTAPAHWEVLWEKRRSVTLGWCTDYAEKTERLYRVRQP